MVIELIELNRWRIEHDVTYADLAREIGMLRATLYRALTVPNARVTDRTLFKIQRFLCRVRSESAA